MWPVNGRMSRDQRVRDNWALYHAIDLAKLKAPVGIVFNLVRQPCSPCHALPLTQATLASAALAAFVMCRTELQASQL